MCARACIQCLTMRAFFLHSLHVFPILMFSCVSCLSQVELHAFPCSPISLTLLMLFSSLQLHLPELYLLQLFTYNFLPSFLLITLAIVIFLLFSPEVPYMKCHLAFLLLNKKKGIYVSNLSAQLDCKFFKGRNYDLFLHLQQLRKCFSISAKHALT